MILCRFGDGNQAVGRFSTPNGCVCYPQDKFQDLCAQHIIKDGMLSGAELIEVYDKSFFVQQNYIGSINGK